MSNDKAYLSIVSHYERCLEKHGDSHLGVDWVDAGDAELRYRTILEVVQEPAAGPVSLLDFGCGTAGLLDHINRRGLSHLAYSGLDLSPAFVEVSRAKYPDNAFFSVDILDTTVELPCYDYVVMNGVFTERGELSFARMFAYFRSMIERVYSHCRRGIAFNVRSEHVAAHEADLFHLPFDTLAGFLTERISRRFVLRHDYLDDEYMAFVYRPD